MDTGLEALATALYVAVDDLLKDHPEVLPPRPQGPQVGITAVISDAEIITLAVVQACWATPVRPLDTPPQDRYQPARHVPPSAGPVRLQQARPLTDRHHDLGMRRPASGLAR